MPRIKMIIEYDGSNYHGFQRQNNAHTIQAEIEQQLLRLTGENINICGAGRTDAGVHARGQVIAFNTDSSIPAERWTQALNTFLAEDIRVLSSKVVSTDFHPRINALNKRYSYYLYRQKAGACFYRNYALCCTEPLDVESMQRACQYIYGTHNFQAFCASGSTVKNYKRTVTECLIQEEGPIIRLDIAANGFLYNMVRIVMGTLLQVGNGRIKPDEVGMIIASKDRTKAGPTVRAEGLFMQSISYPPEYT